MKVRYSVAILLLVLLISTFGSAIKVIDVTGFEIDVTRVPNRIVALVPSDAEMLFDLGLGSKVVGVNDWAEYPAEVKNIEKIGGSPLNIEKILSLSPDIVVGNYGLAPKEIEQLRQLGLMVIAVNPRDLDTTLETYLLVGKALGASDKALEIVENLEKRQNTLASFPKMPKVFVEIWNDPLMTAGKGSLWNDVITKAGGENIGAMAVGSYPIYSEEDLIKQSPDLIILTNYNLEEALQRPVYASFKDRLVQVDPSLYSFPTKRLWDGLEALYETLINLQ